MLAVLLLMLLIAVLVLRMGKTEERLPDDTVPVQNPDVEQLVQDHAAAGAKEVSRTDIKEKLVDPKTASESEIAADSTQYVYNRDYFVGDYVTVEHKRFGMIQPKVQLIGMIEAFDQNGRSLTPTFRKE